MGSSHTYHVIGIIPLEPGRDRLVCAMSRAEMVQQLAIVARDDQSISHWFAQTKTGQRVLGSQESCTTSELPRMPKLVVCPVCNGNNCPVCNYSGVCKRNHWLKWQPWQIENMKKRYNTKG